MNIDTSYLAPLADNKITSSVDLPPFCAQNKATERKRRRRGRRPIRRRHHRRQLAASAPRKVSNILRGGVTRLFLALQSKQGRQVERPSPIHRPSSYIIPKKVPPQTNPSPPAQVPKGQRGLIPRASVVQPSFVVGHAAPFPVVLQEQLSLPTRVFSRRLAICRPSSLGIPTPVFAFAFPFATLRRLSAVNPGAPIPRRLHHYRV